MKFVHISVSFAEARGVKRPSCEGCKEEEGFWTHKSLLFMRWMVVQGGMRAETEYSSIWTSGALQSCAEAGKKKPPVSTRALRNSRAGAVAGEDAVDAAQ